MKTSKSGFHVVEVLLILAIVAVLAFVGWRVWEAQIARQAEPNTTQMTQDQSSADAPEINNTSDLDKAAETLDSLNLNDSDQEVSELEKELNSL